MKLHGLMLVALFSLLIKCKAQDLSIYKGNDLLELLYPLELSYGIPKSKPGENVKLPLVKQETTPIGTISTYRNGEYEVIVQQIKRGSFIEINGELNALTAQPSALTLKILLPFKGNKWEWFQGLDMHTEMLKGKLYFDTISVSTAFPPDGAFNGNTLSEGGYGDAVGRGSMSYYPLCAIALDGNGRALGIDMNLPMVYRLGSEKEQGLFAEFDIATSPFTEKFPNRAFFKLCSFDFNAQWGMRSALESYYAIYPAVFAKRVIHEGIWLPFTSLRSIRNWEDFGFAFHETAWNTHDIKDGVKVPNIVSDKGTSVMSFQYTEPWDIQLPITTKNMTYDAIVSDDFIPLEHREYLAKSATRDKNARWQTRRLETPWFDAGWAVSITTNCDPDLPGYNRYQYVVQDEIKPAVQLNVDGIYFDSMEWNWHHDLNYNQNHFAYTDFPLTFSKNVGRPAIWNFSSEFEMMKRISDEMHLQGKLTMGNGHGWNPFAAANLDLFGAELNWYYSGDHNTTALDFKRAISYRKPIVFLLNEGLNDTAFTTAPYNGYKIYFEKLLAYGFFPSFFSVDASNDPYWQDSVKIENGRPYFKKYIPFIRKIAAAGWEPVTFARCSNKQLRIERFGKPGNLYFTVHNSTNQLQAGTLIPELADLGLNESYKAIELLCNSLLQKEQKTLIFKIPAQSTFVIQIVE